MAEDLVRARAGAGGPSPGAALRRFHERFPIEPARVGPRIHARQGVSLHVDESQDILAEVRAQLVQLLHACGPDELRDSDLVQEKMRALLKRYFRKEMGRRPMILPVLVEV